MGTSRRHALLTILAVSTAATFSWAGEPAEPIAFATPAADIEQVVMIEDPAAIVTSRYREPKPGKPSGHSEHHAIDLAGNDHARCERISAALGKDYRVISEKMHADGTATWTYFEGGKAYKVEDKPVGYTRGSNDHVMRKPDSELQAQKSEPSATPSEKSKPKAATPDQPKTKAKGKGKGKGKSKPKRRSPTRLDDAWPMERIDRPGEADIDPGIDVARVA